MQDVNEIIADLQLVIKKLDDVKTHKLEPLLEAGACVKKAIKKLNKVLEVE